MKIEITKNNCYGMIDGRLQQLPIGHILELPKNPYGEKARIIEEQQLTLEVATPEPKRTITKKTRRSKKVDGDQNGD
ncbi:MAG: hypothetical protein ACPHUL_00875 [Marinomonas gallaica]